MVYTNAGKGFLCNWLSGGGFPYSNPISITMGSGTTTASATDTSLEHEIGSANNAGSIWRISPFSSISFGVGEVTFEGVFSSTCGSNTTFSEVGIFNTSGAGTGSLFARTTFVPTVKTINEEWSILYTIKG